MMQIKAQGNKCQVIIWLVFGLLACSQETKQPSDYIDPFICTQGDHGQWLPAALVPFGMVELCPDTYPGSLIADGDFAHGGYDYSDHQLRGFSHVHRGSSGGTGITDRAGMLSFVPYTNAPSDTFFINPVLDFDKSSEVAKAGYYKADLTRDNIQVELTATEHVGMQRYSYTEKKLSIYSSMQETGGEPFHANPLPNIRWKDQLEITTSLPNSTLLFRKQKSGMVKP